jgi:hypothetical protein
MLGLFFSEAILFVAAALIGFAIGWRLYALVSENRRRAEERDMEQLRAGLTDAQVRRARTT